MSDRTQLKSEIVSLGGFLRENCGTLREAFSLLDVTQTGSLTQERFTQGLVNLGFKGDAEAIFKEMDKQKAGSISLRDFIVYFTTKSDWKLREGVSLSPKDHEKPQDLAAVLADMQFLREETNRIQSEGRSQHLMVLQAVESRPNQTDVIAMVREEFERRSGDIGEKVEATMDRVLPKCVAKIMAETVGRLEMLEVRVRDTEASIESLENDDKLRGRCSSLFDLNSQVSDGWNDFSEELKDYGRKIEVLEQNAAMMEKKHALLIERVMGGITDITAMIDKPTASPESTVTSPHASWMPAGLPNEAVRMVSEDAPITYNEVNARSVFSAKQHSSPAFGDRDVTVRAPAPAIMAPNSPSSQSLPSQSFQLRHTLPTSMPKTSPPSSTPQGYRDILRQDMMRRQSPAADAASVPQPTRAVSPGPVVTMTPDAKTVKGGSIHIRVQSQERQMLAPKRSPSIHHRRTAADDLPGYMSSMEAPPPRTYPNVPQHRQTLQRSAAEHRSCQNLIASSSQHAHSPASQQQSPFSKGWPTVRQQSVPNLHSVLR